MLESLKKIYNYESLSSSEAEQVILAISEQDIPEALISALLIAYNFKEPTVQEIYGFRTGLIKLSKQIDLSEFNPIDICGTGGDGKNTFNISTLSSFIICAANIKVAKHGNYSVSSKCGSSNILEFFGYKFTNDEDILKEQLDRYGICFLHAPLFHPTMKKVANTRKTLAIKTFFNMIGPLINPAKVTNQLIGVYSLKIANIYRQLFDLLPENLTVLYDLNEYDEISLTGKVHIASKHDTYTIAPNDFGLKPINPIYLNGGQNIEEAAKIFMDILTGKGNEPQNQVVLVNSAIAIKSYQPEISIQDAFEMAKEALISKKALNVFKKVTQSY